MAFGLLMFALLLHQVEGQSSVDYTTKQWAIKKHKSILYESEGRLSGDEGRSNDFALIKQKNEANLKLTNAKRFFDAKISEGMANVKMADGQQATANKVGNTGIAQARKNVGTMRNVNERGGANKTLYFDANGKNKLAAKRIDNNRLFNAQGANDDWQVLPERVNQSETKGLLKINGNSLNYSVVRNGNDKVFATLANNSNLNLVQKQTQYKCTSHKVGMSTCYDNKGKKVGEVRASNNGEVIVTNPTGVAVAVAKGTKDKNGKPVVILNNGLLNAQSDKQRDFDCPGVPTDSIQVQKPVYFKYPNQRTTDGGVEWDWPACIEIGANITVKPGILIRNLAFKWTVNVLPVGRLACNNALANICSSGGECLFCNLCDSAKVKEIDMLDNSASNMCETIGPNKYMVKATVCPPPESTHFFYCDGFTKSVNDPYWKKKGDLDFVLDIFNQKTEAEFQADWKDLIKRAKLIGIYKSETFSLKNTVSLLTMPSESDVQKWYLTTKGDKIGCHESIVSYNLFGSKIKTDFLLEAATVGGIFKKSDCNKNKP